jgi:hypothetical protein
MNDTIDRRLNRLERQLTGIQTLLAALVCLKSAEMLDRRMLVSDNARIETDYLRERNVLDAAKRLAEEVHRR